MKQHTPPGDRTKIRPIDHDNLQALYNTALPREAGGTTVRGRPAKERLRMKPFDGHRLRSKGRDRQYSTGATSDLFERVDDVLDRFDLTQAEFTECAQGSNRPAGRPRASMRCKKREQAPNAD